jgi:AraC-like DNA-binding protein
MAIQTFQVLTIMGYLFLESVTVFAYLLLLGLVGPLFFLYSQHVIQSDKQWSLREGLHFLPVFIFAVFGSLFPDYFGFVYSVMFLIGGVYMSNLAWSLYQLRKRRTLFQMEFIFVVSFLAWAMAVVLVGMLSAQAVDDLIPAQVIMLAMAIAAAVHIQLNYPHLLSSLEEVASRQYQTSTLMKVDCEEIKQKLVELMTIKKVYQDSELSLSSLAEKLSLKSHQLSEYINTQLGTSFSSYLRSQRVNAAEALLIAEPDVSVLAVGLSVGFSSQSAFYTAFKEIHAIAPGQYRKQLLAK